MVCGRESLPRGFYEWPEKLTHAEDRRTSPAVRRSQDSSRQKGHGLSGEARPGSPTQDGDRPE